MDCAKIYLTFIYMNVIYTILSSYLPPPVALGGQGKRSGIQVCQARSQFTARLQGGSSKATLLLLGPGSQAPPFYQKKRNIFSVF